MSENNFNNGNAAAAIVAACFGSAALGVLVVLSEAFPEFKKLLNLYDPVGPLSGKVVLTIIFWLCAWIIFHVAWKKKDVHERALIFYVVILLVVAFVGTFPPFYGLFTRA